MTDTESKTHFQKLLDREKDSRMEIVAREGVKIMIWKKGEKDRETFKGSAYSKDRKALELSGDTETKLVGSEVLYGFTLNGLSYFGKGKIVKVGLIELDCHNDLFKSEKRKNYRLLTYPHKKVFLKIKTDLKAEDSKGNVVDFRTGVSQTALFKNFIELMGLTDDELENDGYFSFRVLDLSVAGISVIVNDASKDIFSTGKEFTNLILKINGITITIPRARSLYLVDMVSQNTKQRLKKVALEFQDVDLTLDTKLSGIINTSLRNFENDFEDFI
jgi:hypothetical protein